MASPMPIGGRSEMAGTGRASRAAVQPVTREVVGVFADEPSLRAAADALLIAGFDRAALALLAGERQVEARLGHPCDDIAELEDDPIVPTRHYVGIDSRIEGEAAIVGGCVYVAAILAVGTVVAADGSTMAALVAAALAGAIAGLAGFGLVRWLQRRHSRHLMKQIRRGGIPLWVHVNGAAQEERASDILRRHGAGHVHAHDRPAAAYEMAGGVSYQLSFMRALGL